MNHRSPINDPPGAAPGGYREVLRVAWPLIVSTGSFSVMMFIDRMFLAWHSLVSIQAALPAGIIAFTLICGFMALAAYASTFVAQYHGAGDPEGCARSTAQGCFIALACWPVLILLIPLGKWMLQISGHPPEVLGAELSYFTILMIGGGGTLLSSAVSSFFTGRGCTRTTMFANITGNACNIALDYVLIFGKLGAPAMGIKGAAWATVISGFISPLILTLLFFSRSTDAAFKTRRTFSYNHRLFWRIIRFGLPSGIHLALDIASFSVFVLLTGRMGPVALAASNIALSINMLAFMPFVGLGIGASVLVGRYQGARQPDYAEKAGWSALKLGIIYMLIIGATFVLFPEAYFSLFAGRSGTDIPFQEVLPIGKVLLVIMTAWGIMDAGNMIIGSALKGAGDTKFVMYYSVAIAWGVLVVGQMVLVLYLDSGIIISWIWTAFYIMVLATGFFWRFRSGSWRTIEVLERRTPLEPARPAGEAMLIAD